MINKTGNLCWGMAGIEPTLSKSSDWTPFSPCQQSLWVVVYTYIQCANTMCTMYKTLCKIYCCKKQYVSPIDVK